MDLPNEEKSKDIITSNTKEEISPGGKEDNSEEFLYTKEDRINNISNIAYLGRRFIGTIIDISQIFFAYFFKNIWINECSLLGEILSC